MRGWKLGWEILWPVLWYLGIMAAAALVCPVKFSVLEVAGLAAAATALTLLAGERIFRGRGFQEIMQGGSRALGYGWLLIPAGRADMVYGSKVWEQLLISCIMIPFTEELVFREMGYGKLRKECRTALAAGITALLFGIYHFQLVQGMYAVCLGLLLAVAYERCGGLPAAFLVHAVSNLTSVVLAMEEDRSWLWEKKLFVVSVTLVSGFLLGMCVRRMRNADSNRC